VDGIEPAASPSRSKDCNEGTGGVSELGNGGFVWMYGLGCVVRDDGMGRRGLEFEDIKIL